jgi:hypothetical protein
VKGIVLLHVGVLFFNAANICQARTLPQASGQFGQLLAAAESVNLHAAVVQVPRVPVNPDFGRYALGKVAEPYALNPAANQVASGDQNTIVAQRPLSSALTRRNNSCGVTLIILAAVAAS